MRKNYPLPDTDNKLNKFQAMLAMFNEHIFYSNMLKRAQLTHL